MADFENKVPIQQNYFYSVKMALDCLKIIKYITQMHFLGKLAWVCCAIGSVMRIWPPSSVAICIDYQMLPVVRLYIVESTSWSDGRTANSLIGPQVYLGPIKIIQIRFAPDILILEV